jgi:hypothetical protein
MRRSLPATLLLLAGPALACGVEETNGPAGPGPTMEAQPAGPAAVVVTTTTALDQAGDVGWYTSLASGSDGRQHVTYTDFTNLDLKYATCASGCGSANNWTWGVIDKDGSVGQSNSVEVGSDGRRHVVYRDETNRDLKYATCAPTANCVLAANWKKIRVDAHQDAGLGNALTLGADGRKHVSYLRRRSGPVGETMALRYATCSSGCAQAANWTTVTVDEGPNSTAAPDYFLATSIAIGRDGRRHISYLNAAGSDLRHATCLSNCTSPANWQKVTVDEGAWQIGFHSSLAVGTDGVVHVSYWDRPNADLLYARCAVECSKPWGWKKVRVATNLVGGYTSLALEASGRVLVSYYDNTALSLATCSGGCTVPLGWTRAVLDGADHRNVGLSTSLTARNGVVRISYYDRSKGDLKFLTRTPLVIPF